MKFRYLLCVVVLLLSSGLAHSQGFEAGMQAYSPYDINSFESVNLSNGNLILNIPLLSYPQLGQLPDLTVSVNYQNFGWTYNYDCDDEGDCDNFWSWNTPTIYDWGTNGAFVNWFSPDIAFNSQFNNWFNSYFPYEWVVDQTGGSHDLGYTGPSTGSPLKLAAADGSGWGMTLPVTTGYGTYISSSPYGKITSKRGITTIMPSYTNPYYTYQDPAGNTITYNGSTYTDSLHRGMSAGIPMPPLSVVSPGCTTLAYPGPPSSSTVYVKYCYSTYTVTSSSFDAGTSATRYTQSWNLLSSVTLPNNTTWAFNYDSAGNLNEVTLPTGGTVSYTWYIDGPGCEGYPSCAAGVLYRDVNANDGSGAKRWTYTLTNYGGPVSPVTTVTDPDGNDTVHTIGLNDTYYSSSWLLPYETQVQYYKGSSVSGHGGTLLKTVATTYSKTFGLPNPIDQLYLGDVYHDFFVPMTITTILNDTNQVSETCIYYDGQVQQSGYSSGNCHSVAFGTLQTWSDLWIFGSSLTNYTYPPSFGSEVERDEYDYNTGTPGSLLRTTKTAYQWQASGNSYLTAGLMDRPSSIIKYNGGGTSVAQTTYNYDESTYDPSCSSTACGNQTSIYNYASSTTPSPTHYSYNAEGMQTQMIDTRNNHTCFTYDSTGAFLSEIQRPNPTPSTGSSCSTALVEYYSFDKNTGLNNSETDANSQTTSYTYDSTRRLLSVTYPDGGMDSYSYNDTVSYPNSPNCTYTKKITSGTNFVEECIVDGFGREIQIKTTVPPSTCSGGFSYVNTAYDNEGRKASVSNPFCTTSDPTYGITKTVYDPLNRVCVVIPQDGTPVSGTSCPTSQPTNDIFTSYASSAPLHALCATSTDEAGRSRTSCSDALGRITTVWEAPASLNYETSYSYDALDNLTSVSQSSSRNRTFTYDWLSRLVCAANPEVQNVTCPASSTSSFPSGSVQYSYDANGNVTSKIAPLPNQTSTSLTVTTTYAYDALNRLSSKVYSDGTTPGAYYYYDQTAPWGFTLMNPIGRLTNSGTNNGTWLASEIYSYDPLGRVSLNQQCTTCSRGWSFSMGYSYDLFGDMIAHDNGAYTVGQGVTFTQTFDATAHLTGITSTYSDSQHPATLMTVDTSIGFWPNNAIRKMALGNGLTQTSAMNIRLQPCRLNVNTSGTGLANCSSSTPSGNIQDLSAGFNLGTSDNGNVTSWSGVGNQYFNRTYNYDALNRLYTLSDSVSGNMCPGLFWQYDAWGNLQTQTVTSGTCGSLSLTYNTSNRITNTGILYDAAGNMTNDGTHSYTYDAENRVIAVDGGSTASYVYNAHGQRVLKTAGGVTTEYYHDLSGNVLGEAQGTTVTTEYIYANQRLLAEYTGGTTYFVHQDHLGSTRLMTNVTGCIVSSHDYLPFGELNPVGSTSCTPADTTHKCTGKERDSESGLDNFGARYDSSQFGRFMTPDPGPWILLNPQSYNAYSYGLNNPVRYSDYAGETAQDRVDAANKFANMGIPYVWGGKDPSCGLDCSGLVQNVFEADPDNTISILDKVQSAASQANDLQSSGQYSTDINEAKPGDALFFYDPSSGKIVHAGIIVDKRNGKVYFVHAPRAGEKVRQGVIDMKKLLLGKEKFAGLGRPIENNHSVSPQSNNPSVLSAVSGYINGLVESIFSNVTPPPTPTPPAPPTESVTWQFCASGDDGNQLCP